jgi:uncharacterized membrane protein
VVFLRTAIILLSLLLLVAGGFAVPASLSASATPAATPDFAISASPSNLTITDGSMGFSTVSVTSLNGFAGNVTLSPSSIPVGFGVGISPSILSLEGNGTAKSTVNVNDQFNGTTTWFLNIIGTSTSLSHSTTIQVNGEPFIAPTFTISSVNPFIVAQGFSNSTGVVVSSQHNFNGTVSLTASVFPNFSGGPTLTLSPTQVNVPPGGSGASTLTVSTSLATPIGFYNYTLTGTAPEGGGFITAQFNGALTVEASTLSEFSISANPSSQNVPVGANATSTILLSSVNGFSGTITLSTSAPPLCVSCPSWTVTPTQVVLSSGGTANATLIFFTVPGSPPNTYTVTVTGASGGVSHSVNVAFTIVSSKPDFSIFANPTTVILPSGGQGNSTITLTSLNSFNGTVSLQTSPSPLCPTPFCTVWSITPSSVNLSPGGTAFATLEIIGGAAGTSGNITVTGTSGSLTHSVNVVFMIFQSQPPPDFSLSAVPGNLTITQGSSATSTITVTSLNGFNGTVTLTDAVSSSQIVATLSQTIVSLSSGGSVSVTLTVSASTSTSPGSYSVTVTGASGTIAHQVQVGVTVNGQSSANFSISANPSSLTILRGSSGTSTLTITSLNGFAGTVSMFSTASPSGLFMSQNPANVTLQSGGSANSILTVFTTNGTGLGTYQVTVTGFSGNLSRSVTLSVNVVTSQQSFTLSINPLHLNIVQGSAGTTTVTVGSVNGFSGTVTLTAVSNSPNLSTSISPTTIAGNGTATVTVVGSANGNYTVTVTGNCCNMTRSATFSVTVTSPPPPDFTLTISPTNQTIRRGSTATYTITVKGSNGFNGTVTLSATISPVHRHGPRLSFPSTVGPDSTSTLTVATGHNTPTGIYMITVTATSGSLDQTFTITLDVTA